jgi:predicted HTH domain antitoxin
MSGLGLDAPKQKRETVFVSITLDLDEQALASLPLGPGERERHMQIELACRFYASGWLSLGQASRMAKLDRYAFGVALAERGIPRQYSTEDLDADLRYAGGQ